MPLKEHHVAYARRLLGELEQHRDKLLGNLLHPQAKGNLEEACYDPIIMRLGAVQGCIQATRDYIKG